jgi:glycerate kinase
MAEASGLEMVPLELRNPLTATSYGTGELIRAALDSGVTRIVMGIGGSATVDGGAGMLQALGAGLLDAEGRQIAPGGGGLAALETVDLTTLDPRLRTVSFEVACDVDNPLTGPHGAAAMFGPQKGATAEMIPVLECGLQRLAALLGEDIAHQPGAGAAGGVGFALLACAGAELKPGVALVAEVVGLEARMHGADLVFTGEGRIDAQTAHGKTPAGVAAIAKRLGIPVVALAGSVGAGTEGLQACGIDAIFSVMQRPSSRAEAFAEATENLRITARNVAMLWTAASARAVEFNPS